MRISRENDGLRRHRWRGSKFARHLKMSRGRNLRKDAGVIEESNLDRFSKGPQLGTCYEITLPSDHELGFLLLLRTVL